MPRRTGDLPTVQAPQYLLANTMKTILLLGIGVLYLAHLGMVSASEGSHIFDDDTRGNSRPKDNRKIRRRSSRTGSSNEQFRRFADTHRDDLQKKVADYFPNLDDYFEHDPKVWADLSEKHIAVLLRHVSDLAKSTDDRDDLLNEDDMLAILKSRKSPEPCVLIGSSIFDAHRVTAEMLKFVDYECYEMILGVRRGRYLASSTDNNGDFGDQGRDGRRSGRPYGAFYSRARSDTKLPGNVVKRYVESYLQVSQLRIRSSSSHGRYDLQSCGLLGLYSRYMTPKQIGQIGWPCLQSAIEAERRCERSTKGRRRSTSGKRNGDDRTLRTVNSKKGDDDYYDSQDNEGRGFNADSDRDLSGQSSYDHERTISPNMYRLDDKVLRHLPGRLVRDGKEEFVTYLLKRMQFGALSGQLQAELFKSEDVCRTLKASEVFDEYNGEQGLQIPSLCH